ncbi:hypothetical protein TEA_020171 [Camellia sinensis var. sinensis]|uniref:Uncharacterized protein n=1 Tax=Camellia sinensis var. sinensis TaxID=542762 RepID=A0A4S4DH85_CAMSN|nr:hypothetical protein TEA_020171 [Camellia sinensis var. sinensis]
MMESTTSQTEFDYLFKLLMIGDSGVGKSSLLLSFTSDTFEDLSPTIGVDFKVKYVVVGGKKLKLAIWDTGYAITKRYVLLIFDNVVEEPSNSESTWMLVLLKSNRELLINFGEVLCEGKEPKSLYNAGQERFRTLTSSYYRGAQGIIMVYDVTRRDTFTNLSEVWGKEIELYSTNQDCIKMLVGNKVDKESERVVTKKEGINFAREYGCLFIECSAKTRVNVQQCFEELILKILDTPSLLAEGSKGVKKNIFKEKPLQSDAATSNCC